jgi:hypothetical protein
MVTTTVRLDRGRMARATPHARRLHMYESALIRDATLAYVVGIEANERLVCEHVGDVMEQHDWRLEQIERYIRRGGRRCAR